MFYYSYHDPLFLSYFLSDINIRHWLSFTVNSLIVAVELQSVSTVTQRCPALCDPVNRSMPGLPVDHQLPEFTQTHVSWVGDAIQPSHHLLSTSLPAFNISQHQGLFKWISFSHQVVTKYWNFSFSVSPSNEYSWLISFRIDWFDLLAV